MKVLVLALCVVALGVVCAESLNEDQLRDQLNYVSKRRSKRALCGSQRVPSTPRPTWFRFTQRPWQCSQCLCHNLMVSKRTAVDLSAKIGIFPQRCSNYKLCCGNRWPIYPFAVAGGSVPSSAVASAKAFNVNDMASSLVRLVGKRATDSQFKKPSMDLIFLIDDSGSISASQFTVAKEGAATLSQALCPHTFGSEKGKKQVSVVLFSTTAKTVLTYEQSLKGTGYVEDTILNLKQRSGATSTVDAIKHVREKVLTQPGNRLNDKDTATVVFVVTDGKCNDGCSTLKSESEKLRKAGPGVQVFAFGVGEADCHELEDIRGKDAGKVFGLPDYNFFEKMANAVKEQMAKNTDVCVK